MTLSISERCDRLLAKRLKGYGGKLAREVAWRTIESVPKYRWVAARAAGSSKVRVVKYDDDGTDPWFPWITYDGSRCFRWDAFDYWRPHDGQRPG